MTRLLVKLASDLGQGSPGRIRTILEAEGLAVEEVKVLSSAGPDGRRAFTDARWVEVARFIRENKLPIRGRGAWIVIHRNLPRHLILCKALPSGA